jgi:tetratricopeptide (TPR) repeat protein
MITLFLLAISLAVFIAANENQYKTLNLEIDQILKPFRWGERKQVKNIIVTVISLILFFALTTLVYGFSKASFSYRKMYQSNKAASEDMIPEAYEYQKQAKNLTPHLDSVRRTYALINLEIAIALSNKTDLNPAEQDQILQLVNQAIREAKAATLLDPQNYQNWLSLAEIYLQLIDTTTQAQQEAFNALAQAINYNPNNPDLRMKLGQLFFSLKDYPNAVTFFGQAIERKPDLARAYYALAKSYQANKQYEDAQAALTSTLSLLNPDSADYVKVETELEDIANQIKASETANSDEIVQLEEENNESSASSQLNIAEEQSNLSGLLGQEDTEQIIQDEALVGEGQTIGN